MKSNIGFAFGVIIGLVVVSSSVGGEEFKQEVVRLKKTDLQGQPIEIEVRRTKFPPDNIHKYGFWGGSEVPGDRLPDFLVSNISVKVGKEEIYIPLSAYGDLTEAREVSVDLETKKTFQLKISGGDTAGSYTAVLTFANGALTKRKVWSGEFPDERFEETKYSWIPDNGR